MVNLLQISLEGKMAVTGTNIQDHYDILKEMKDKNSKNASKLMEKHLQALKMNLTKTSIQSKEIVWAFFGIIVFTGFDMKN